MLVVTLSLGIGMAVSVAAFSVTSTLVFGELAGIADRSGLIRLRWGTAQEPISEEDFDVIEQARGGAFSVFAADGTRPVPVILPSGAVTLPAAFVSVQYFETLGTVPVRGRLLTAADSRTDESPVVLISERVWRDSFETSDDVLGRTITVGGRLFTIVGVTPVGFPGLLQRDVGYRQADYPQVWLPLRHATLRSSLASRSRAVVVRGRTRPPGHEHDARAGGAGSAGDAIERRSRRRL